MSITTTSTATLHLNPPLNPENRLRLTLGQANPWKEGDDAIGIASKSEDARKLARQQLLAMKVEDVDANMICDDQVKEFIESVVDKDIYNSISKWTIEQLKQMLLSSSSQEIREIMPGLPSDVIGTLTKCMTNDELAHVSSKIFNNRPGSTLGAEGYLSSRIQPNSPTDDPLEIFYSVLEGLSYGTGDAIFGINPVSSDPASVLALEQVLKDLVETFSLQNVTRYAVLAHVDEQLAVEDANPNMVDVAFQSIAGNEATNNVFGVSMQKLLNHMKRVRGMYFETGQGSAVTNNQAQGVDMVILESRAQGVARAMQRLTGHEFMIINTVAGFIGPEVFKTKEQLIRACLEDIFIGKLHGLIIGADVCSTYHMGIDLDEILQVQREVLKAHPAFLMAVAGQADPMLSYITTSFRDHPRLRKYSGRRVTKELEKFLQTVGIMDEDGNLTEKTGDTEWMYYQYRLRKGDVRSEEEIRKEARRQLSEFQKRGLDLGYGHEQFFPPKDVDERARTIYNFSKYVIMQNLSESFIGKRRQAGDLILRTVSKDREDYVAHPSSGEVLDVNSLESLKKYASSLVFEPERIPVQIVISDGLNPRAVDDPRHFPSFFQRFKELISQNNQFQLLDNCVVVENGRVRAGYQVGRLLFAGQGGATIHVVGERPGNGNNTFSVYIAAADGRRWSLPVGHADSVDHGTVSLVSGVSVTAMPPESAAEQTMLYLKKRFQIE